MAVPSDYSDEEIAAAIIDCGGYISGIAKRLGCSSESIRYRIVNTPELRDLQLDFKEEMLDQAELGLSKAVYAEKAWAIKFALSRLGRKRGYGQKIEVEGSGGAVGRVVMYLPEDGREQRAPDGDSTSDRSTDAGASQ